MCTVFGKPNPWVCNISQSHKNDQPFTFNLIITDWCRGPLDLSSKHDIGVIVEYEQGKLLKCDLEPKTFIPIWINVTSQESNTSQPTLSQALDKTTTSTTHSLSAVSTSTQTTSTRTASALLVSTVAAALSSPQQPKKINKTDLRSMEALLNKTDTTHEQNWTNHRNHRYSTTTKSKGNSQIIISVVTPVFLITICLTICTIVWCNQRCTVKQPTDITPSTDTTDANEEEEAENEYDTISGDYHHYDDVGLQVVNAACAARQPETCVGLPYNHNNIGEDDNNHDDDDDNDVASVRSVADNYVLDAESVYTTKL